VISVFVPIPWRFYLWGIALLISLLLPLVLFNLGRNNPQVQAQIDIATTVSPSLVERFGLFSIIVLGEVIVGVVAGATEHHHMSWEVGLTTALGALVAIGLWWVYFDSVSHHLPRPGAAMVSGWFYLHLPLTMGIASFGAAVFNTVAHAGEHLSTELRWLLVIALTISLISIAVLTTTIQLNQIHQRTHRVGRRAMLVSAVLILLLGFTSLETIPLLIAAVLLLLAPISFAFRVWLEMLDQSS
jgi:low temperature requirement protein LtrA